MVLSRANTFTQKTKQQAPPTGQHWVKVRVLKRHFLRHETYQAHLTPNQVIDLPEPAGRKLCEEGIAVPADPFQRQAITPLQERDGRPGVYRTTQPALPAQQAPPANEQNRNTDSRQPGAAGCRDADAQPPSGTA